MRPGTRCKQCPDGDLRKAVPTPGTAFACNQVDELALAGELALSLSAEKLGHEGEVALGPRVTGGPLAHGDGLEQAIGRALRCICGSGHEAKATGV